MGRGRKRGGGGGRGGGGAGAGAGDAEIGEPVVDLIAQADLEGRDLRRFSDEELQAAYNILTKELYSPDGTEATRDEVAARVQAELVRRGVLKEA